MRNTRIEPGFYLCLAAAFLLIPLRLVIAWLLAVTIHELFHYLALKACGVNVRDIKITTSGVVMQVEELEGWKEILCALAGPAGGLLLVLLSRRLPYTAICGLFHSCYNLLPIFSLDGGRALKAVLAELVGVQVGERVHDFISRTLIILLVLLCIYLSLRYNLPMWPILVAVLLIVIKSVRKFPCKQDKQIVQ